MTSVARFDHQFVEFVPTELEPVVLYISVEYATAVHACACGCGGRVVTPLSPVDWRLTFDGETVSLRPSIGNWSFECQSHYLITENAVEWAPRLSRQQIEGGRRRDRAARAIWLGEAARERAAVAVPNQVTVANRVKGRVARWFSRRSL